jgi:GTPase SAR1 family protein
MEVFRITLLGTAQTGKTTLATTVITKSLLGQHHTKYLRTRRNEFFFTKIKGVGIQLQDSVGGKEIAPSMDEIKAIQDEERTSDFGGGGIPTPASLDEDESSMLLTKREGNPLLANQKTGSYVIIYTQGQHDTLQHAISLVRGIRPLQPMDDPVPIIVICNKKDTSNTTTTTTATATTTTSTTNPTTSGVIISPNKLPLNSSSPANNTSTTSNNNTSSIFPDSIWFIKEYPTNIYFFYASIIRNDYISAGGIDHSGHDIILSSPENARKHYNADDLIIFIISKMKSSKSYEIVQKQRQLQLEQSKSTQHQQPQDYHNDGTTSSTNDTATMGMCAKFCSCCYVGRKNESTDNNNMNKTNNIKNTKKASEMKSG